MSQTGRASFDQRDLDCACPACDARDVRSFYRLVGVPVHSVLLMPTRDEALAYPARDLELASCDACGFVFNAIFDPAVHEYSTRYEETQGFSSTFTGFAKSLAQRLIDEYDLHDKRVLEIGCGKGEFLYLLCTLASNRGIGVDPAYVPGRLPPDADERIEFHQRLYTAADTQYKADFICHRHTLEHIADVRVHLDTIKASLEGRPDVPVWIEVPDVMRVLTEGAFWDIYYEHCSYFTLGSLARLFRRVGFGVSELRCEFDHQYLMIGGTLDPHNDPHNDHHEGEHDLDTTRGAVGEFAKRCGSMISGWTDRLNAIRDADGRAVLWGGGSKAVAFVTTLPDVGLKYAVDINPHKQGRFLPGGGQEVVAPEFLREYRPTHIIVMNPIYIPEIRADLTELRIEAEVLSVNSP